MQRIQSMTRRYRFLLCAAFIASPAEAQPRLGDDEWMSRFRDFVKSLTRSLMRLATARLMFHDGTACKRIGENLMSSRQRAEKNGWPGALISLLTPRHCGCRSSRTVAKGEYLDLALTNLISHQFWRIDSIRLRHSKGKASAPSGWLYPI